MFSINFINSLIISKEDVKCLYTENYENYIKKNFISYFDWTIVGCLYKRVKTHGKLHFTGRDDSEQNLR